MDIALTPEQEAAAAALLADLQVGTACQCCASTCKRTSPWWDVQTVI